MATEVFTSFEQITDSTGAIVSGAEVSVYAAGTTTPLSVYSDPDLLIGHIAANPIICDAYGRHDMMYIAAGSYKVVIRRTGAGATILTRDNIDGRVPVGSGALAIANGGTGSTTAPAALAALGGATAAELADVAADVAALSGTLASTEKTHLATGTTAQRPASPVEGDVRRNTSTSLYEVYTGSAWVNLLTFATASPQPTIQRFTSGTAATYTTPANAVRLRVRMVGGGGGGGAAGTNDGGDGGDTSFSTWTAIKGAKGAHGAAGAGGIGGTGGVDGTGTKIYRSDGTKGNSGVNLASAIGGMGGGTFFSQGAPTTGVGAAGVAAPANTGAGGSGGNSSGATGGGGGGGEFVEFLITSPAATYTYTVGAAGTAGSAGTQAGGAGAAGVIIVEEYYI